MVFSSTIFIFGFLPIFLIAYFIVPWLPAKNLILLAFSLYFYAWGEPLYVGLLVLSIAINWIASILLNKTRELPGKIILVIAVAFNLAIIGFYKYQGFIATTVNQALGEVFIEELELALPIGISFYTLQAISYIVDVYRKRVEVQRNPIYLGMYIAMFPQLVAGPIVRYVDIEKQIRHRRVSAKRFVEGIRQFCVGLGKKVLLADVVGVLASSLLAKDAASLGTVGCISGVLAYSFQIYYDFSGYSNMAIGLGKMMGFDLPKNFDHPYVSRSATEFWRRWHISLGMFFRDYVYIPLGGSRVPKKRYVFNALVVWFLTGLWHGAAWNFILWGMYWGFLVILEHLGFLRMLEKCPSVVQHAYCLIAIFFGWLLFAVSDLQAIVEWLCAIFGCYGLTGTSTLWELQSWSYTSLLPILILGCTPWIMTLRFRLGQWAAADITRGKHVNINANITKDLDALSLEREDCLSPGRYAVTVALAALADISCLVILLLSSLYIITGTYSPFIYFNF